MINPLLTRLNAFIDLDGEDRAAVDQLCRAPRSFRAGQDVIKEGARPEFVQLLLEGWACRYKVLPDGSRQILAYLIPGDLCDMHVFILKRMDHSIGLLSDAKVVSIAKEQMLALTEQRPAVARALWWSTLVDEAILRQWLANVGQKGAYERLAHLFCEMWQRMHQVGLTSEGEFTLPLTQEELGDTVGLTSVHTNRMLQQMRSEGLITLSKGQLTIHDGNRMRQVAGFDANYLHLERRLT